MIARIPVGQDPQEVVITPDNQYALVLNCASPADIGCVIRIPSIGAWGTKKYKDRLAVHHDTGRHAPGERDHQPYVTRPLQ